MKKVHSASFKFHLIYSTILAIIFLIMILLVRDIALGIVMLVLLAYVAGNGIIHGRKNELTRDTIIEYVIVSAIVAVIFLGVLFTR